MRKPLVYLVLAATTLAVGGQSFAATPKLAKAKKIVVKDVAGDANAVNTQNGIVPVTPPATPATPANLKQADILSFTLGRKDNGKKVLALVGTMTLAGPPEMGTDYRIRMSAPGCTTYFLELEKGLAGDSAYLRNNCAQGSTPAMTAFDPIDAVVKGNTITWTVPISALSGDVKLGTVLTVNGAQTSGDTAVIFPGLDEVRTNLTYKVGA